MPTSSVSHFSDPDAYAASIQPTATEVVVTGRGPFSAKLISIDFHRLILRRFSETLPRIIHTAYRGGSVSLQFLIEPGPGLIADGVEYEPGKIVRHIEGANYHQVSSGFTRFGGVSLPKEDMADIGEAMIATDLTPPRDTTLATPPPSALERLQRLHAAAAHLAETAPEIIANPDAANSLEQMLIDAMVGCLDHAGSDPNTLAQGQHVVVMKRFRRVLEEHPDQALYIPEICKAVGVSDNTLRVCCHEHLGMGPRRYLMLRRMHLARRALREATKDTTTVTEIATRYGFWHLARFAGEYQSLFGETPSVTLGQPA